MGMLGLVGGSYDTSADWWGRYGRRPSELAAVSSSLKRSRRSMSKTGCGRCGSFESSCCRATGSVKLGSTGRSDWRDIGDFDSNDWFGADGRVSWERKPVVERHIVIVALLIRTNASL